MTTGAVSNANSLSRWLAEKLTSAAEQGSPAASRFLDAVREQLSELECKPAQAEMEANGKQKSAAASATTAAATQQRRQGLITKDQWTVELLTQDITAGMLSKVEDPAGLMNARVDALRRPTTAYVQNGDGRNPVGINPSYLCTREQAEVVMERMRELGIEPGELSEARLAGPFEISYGAEERRMFTIAGVNAGLMAEYYARYTKETADQRMRDLWLGGEAA
ncbi:MAG: hypothetical protein RBU25_17350 [Lentisphaeria bacterium]|jgi:hypothetical protein|nr:hypothetical protein [Lentisphaeria bacterium]